jgi:D-alanyl-D-alanine carboxypeptidase
MKKISFLLFFTILLFHLKAQSPLVDSLQAALDDLAKNEGVPGATLAITLDDGQVISLAAGWEDKEKKKAMPVGARMLAGSVGKTFFGALALQVMHEKGIELDSRVIAWFGNEAWFKRIPNAEDLTIRMLMNHTTGIPRHVFQAAFLQAIQDEPMKVWKPAEMLQYVLDLPPVHPAGDGWAYSDTNYIILGMLVEKWTGEDLYVLLRKRILKPLKLKNTLPSNTPRLKGLVQGYIGEQNFLNLPTKVVKKGKYVINPQWEWTGGGLLSNVEDLARWLKAIHETDMIPEPMYREMIQPVGLRTGKPGETGYGLTTFVWKAPAGIHYGHSGFFPGYLTNVEYVKELKAGIAVQLNSDQGPGRSLHGFVIDIAGIIERNR